MKKFALMTMGAVALAIGSGFVAAQGHNSGGGRDSASGGWRGGGSPHGGWQTGANRGNWHGNAWYGRGWRGGYGPRAGIYRGTRVWGGWPYPIYYPYPIYAASPYPVYVDPGPTVYVERYPASVYAQPSPPTYVAPPLAAATPEPVPSPLQERLERYTLSAQELFEFDRFVLRMPQPKLDQIADVLSRNPQINQVRITGYTDRLGTDSYNLKLSQRRADAVKAYLGSKGVAASRLIAAGRGKTNPVVQCKETSKPALIKCLEPNRRVEVEQITVERRIR